MTQEIPVHVTFRGLPHVDALDALARDHVAQLGRFADGITRCDVAIELPHGHRHDGRLFHVRIKIDRAGAAPIVVSHEPSLHASAKDAEGSAHHKQDDTSGAHRYADAALRDAFDAARRQLEDVARRQRGDVKTHAAP
jgi:hypothetical protein